MVLGRNLAILPMLKKARAFAGFDGFSWAHTQHWRTLDFHIGCWVLSKAFQVRSPSKCRCYHYPTTGKMRTARAQVGRHLVRETAWLVGDYFDQCDSFFKSCWYWLTTPGFQADILVTGGISSTNIPKCMLPLIALSHSSNWWGNRKCSVIF